MDIRFTGIGAIHNNLSPDALNQLPIDETFDRESFLWERLERIGRGVEERISKIFSSIVECIGSIPHTALTMRSFSQKMEEKRNSFFSPVFISDDFSTVDEVTSFARRKDLSFDAQCDVVIDLIARMGQSVTSQEERALIVKTLQILSEDENVSLDARENILRAPIDYRISFLHSKSLDPHEHMQAFYFLVKSLEPSEISNERKNEIIRSLHYFVCRDDLGAKIQREIALMLDKYIGSAESSHEMRVWCAQLLFSLSENKSLGLMPQDTVAWAFARMMKLEDLPSEIRDSVIRRSIEFSQRDRLQPFARNHIASALQTIALCGKIPVNTRKHAAELLISLIDFRVDSAITKRIIDSIALIAIEPEPIMRTTREKAWRMIYNLSRNEAIVDRNIIGALSCAVIRILDERDLWPDIQRDASELRDSLNERSRRLFADEFPWLMRSITEKLEPSYLRALPECSR